MILSCERVSFFFALLVLNSRTFGFCDYTQYSLIFCVPDFNNLNLVYVKNYEDRLGRSRNNGSCEKGAMRDAGIISVRKKIEHYEIASNRTPRQFSETLGFTVAVSLLETTLDEEKVAAEKLIKVATDAINIEAAQQETQLSKQ